MTTGTCADCPAPCTDADIRTPQGGEWCRICPACRRADAEFAGEFTDAAARMIETAFADVPDATEPELVECAICAMIDEPAAMNIYCSRLICSLCEDRELADDQARAEQEDIDAYLDATREGGL